ncbi:interleukin-17 receptor E-like protein isoform X1 [Aquarana catesbeiana]|uniref:interleukin-17 receptor E-like protein isoform X1 n=1 Tax=Aquarana catesbeiana TaxID=8400 RepID=UPI003CC9D296
MKFHNRECCFLCWGTSGCPLLIFLFCGIANCRSIQRIKECDITCSQGVQCERKQPDDLFSRFCRDAPESLNPNVLENMKITTVMKCSPASQCSLHLNIIGTVIYDVHIRGVEICSMTLSSQRTQCVTIRFTKIKRKKFLMHKIQVQANTFEVGVSEQVYVTMKTFPDFCGIQLTETYYVEDCNNRDVGKHVWSCLTGKLDYMVNKENKIITVNVSNILQDYDYNVRLCKKHFVCHDIGAHAVIRKENATKSVTLPYSEILPCLCIEGWSAIPDARRTRLCPFKNDISTLWDNIAYNPMKQVLAWVPLCPVNAKVHLCWMTDDKQKCVNIPDSLSAAHNQVSYSQVDTHPRLCMKFATETGYWVKCPFPTGPFSAWDMKTYLMPNSMEIKLTSPTKAKFSVFICNRTNFNSCEPLQKYTLVYVEALETVTLNMSREICGSNICIQGIREDVNYSFPTQICDIPCISQDPESKEDNFLQMIIVTAVQVLSAVIFTYIGYKIFKVCHQKREQKRLLKSQVKEMSEIASSLEQMTLLSTKAEGDR